MHLGCERRQQVIVRTACVATRRVLECRDGRAIFGAHRRRTMTSRANSVGSFRSSDAADLLARIRVVECGRRGLRIAASQTAFGVSRHALGAAPWRPHSTTDVRLSPSRLLAAAALQYALACFGIGP